MHLFLGAHALFTSWLTLRRPSTSSFQAFRSTNQILLFYRITPRCCTLLCVFKGWKVPRFCFPRQNRPHIQNTPWGRGVCSRRGRKRTLRAQRRCQRGEIFSWWRCSIDRLRWQNNSCMEKRKRLGMCVCTQPIHRTNQKRDILTSRSCLCVPRWKQNHTLDNEGPKVWGGEQCGYQKQRKTAKGLI